MRRSEEIGNHSSGGGISLSRLPGPDGRRGTMLFHEPMSRHTSWRVGGTADRAYVPADLSDLSLFLCSLPESEPVYMVGLGSNLLVRDGGLRGTVVLLHGALKQICLEQRRRALKDVQTADSEYGLVYAEAGVASPKVARFAARHNLVGAEFLAGIPGTVGGALAMNAGCYGSETWDVVAQVLTVDRRGQIRERLPSEYQIAYRRVALQPDAAEVIPSTEWFAAAWFRLPAGDGAESQRKIKELLQRRIAAQPLNLPNAGSVFRNPAGAYAAQLIEACGLKGHAVGGAMVSPKHANFIVNAGNASAQDIETLIERVRDTVVRVHGIELEREVRIIGECA